MKNVSKNHKSLARNSLLLFIAQIISAVFGIASSVLIARIIGPRIMGQYSYLIWIVSTLTAVGSLGIPNTLIKYIAEYSEGKKKDLSDAIAGNLLVLTIIIGVVTTVVLFLLASFHVFPNSIQTGYFYLLAFILPLTILSSSLTAILRGKRRYQTLLYVGLITSPVMFLMILGTLLISPTLNGLVAYYIVNTIFSFVLLAIFARRSFSLSLVKLPKKLFHSVFKFALSVSGILLLDQIVWSQSEVLFLGHYSTPEQVAFYTVSYTLTTNVMNLFPGSILGALMPHISALHGQENKKEIISSYQNAAKYVGIIVAALVGGGIALASPFIYTVYGSQYSQMIPVFRILLITSGLAAIFGVTATILYGTTQQNIILKTGFILSIINILLDFLIIPFYGATGAALANGISQFIGGIIGIYLLSKREVQFPIYVYIKIVCITIVSSLITSVLVNNVVYKNIGTILLYGTLYLFMFCILMIITKLIEKSELSIINKIFMFKNITVKVVR